MSAAIAYIVTKLQSRYEKESEQLDDDPSEGGGSSASASMEAHSDYVKLS